MQEKIGPSVAEEAQITQFIVFHVGDEEFGVPIGSVQEIVRTGPITPIPDSPEFVEGLVNVRGEIVATINMRARFFLPSEKVEAKHIVITKQQESLFGLLVDEVTEVLRIPETEVKPPHKLITTIHEEYVSGVITLENRLIIVLDLERVLSSDELSRLSEVTRRHREVEERESLKKTKERESKEQTRERPEESVTKAHEKPVTKEGTTKGKSLPAGRQGRRREEKGGT